MGRYLWLVRFLLGVAFTVLAAIQVIPLPANSLAVAVAVVMLALLGWGEIEHRSQHQLPREHLQDLRTTASQLRDRVRAGLDFQFAGNRDDERQLRDSFRKHCAGAFRRWVRWDALRVVRDERRRELWSHADAIGNRIGSRHGINAGHIAGFLRLWAIGQMEEPIRPVATTWNVTPAPDGGVWLFMGGTGVAHYEATNRDATHHIADAEADLAAAVADFAALPAFAATSAAEADLRRSSHRLIESLSEVAGSHRLGGRCRLCD